MKEYLGKSAQNYDQADGNKIILNPNLIHEIPENKNTNHRKQFLDIGCGKGFFYKTATMKGYNYTGIDISKEMIKYAKKRYPDGNFIVCDARKLKKISAKSFDLILINMLLPSIEKKKDLDSIISRAKIALKKDGTIIITTAHPCFDPLMQKFLQLRHDITSDLDTYFISPQKYSVKKRINNKIFIFRDNHWTISDYINTLIRHHLYIISINECQPSKKHRHINKKYYEVKKNFPTFLIIKAKILSRHL